ncbi:MICOS complex subunit MIC27-like isoform X2 [Ornithodoros turicata]
MSEHAAQAASEAEKKPQCKPCCRGKRLKKPSELPLYENPPDDKELVEEGPGAVENGVRTVRLTLTPYYTYVEVASDRLGNMYNTAVEHSKSSYHYITEEKNTVARGMAITVGGLAGLVLGARGGIFRKLIFATTGAGAAAAACYPKEAREFSENYLTLAKDQVTAGVKQATGYDLNDLFSKVKLPKLPDFTPKTIDKVGEQVSEVQYYGFRLGSSKSELESQDTQNPAK